MMLCVAGLAPSSSVFAQGRLTAAGGGLVPAALQQAAASGTQVRRLTADEAVRLAAENNLGIQIARFDPQLESLNGVSARTAWTPTLASSVQQNSRTSPPNSFLSGASGALNSDQFSMTSEVQQQLPWFGASYSAGFDSARSTSNNFFSNFNPQLQSSLSFSFTQPLLRGFKIDNAREQVQLSRKNLEIADVGVRQTVTATSRTVRNAYWELAYQIAALQVARQSLELAEESLRNTRSRIEIGTPPPIDAVEADAEVATRREAVIVAEAQIETAQDTLRALVYNPSMADFWTIRIEPADIPSLEQMTVDVDGAIRNALDRRTDLEQVRKNIEANDITLRFSRNQTLPDVTANLEYGLTGLGGTQFVRGAGFPGRPVRASSRLAGSSGSD